MGRFMVAVLLLVVPAFAFAFAVNAELDDGRIAELLAAHPRLYFLGAVEGKSYFSDNSTLRGWTAARTYCTSMGMNRASIETTAQWDFLKTKTSFLTTRHWTAARDALAMQQFVWDTNRANVTAGVYNGGGTILTALTVYSSGTSLYYSQRSIASSYPVLCESS